MVKEEIAAILGGLKNAIERGESIEKAKSTFLNAGYKSEEVDDAAGLLSVKEVNKEEKKAEKENKKEIKTLTKEKPLPEIKLEPKKKFNIIRAVLVAAAVIIVILIAYLTVQILAVK